jgi:hypothetical protein
MVICPDRYCLRYLRDGALVRIYGVASLGPGGSLAIHNGSS